MSLTLAQLIPYANRLTGGADTEASLLATFNSIDPSNAVADVQSVLLLAASMGYGPYKTIANQVEVVSGVIELEDPNAAPKSDIGALLDGDQTVFQHGILGITEQL